MDKAALVLALFALAAFGPPVQPGAVTGTAQTADLAELNARIAFTSQPTQTGPSTIVTMNADGSDPHSLPVPDLCSGFGTFQPSWSPDGQRIAFICDPARANVGQVLVMNANGSSATQLTFGAERFAWSPSWSPDGTRIVMVGEGPTPCCGYSNQDIYSMHSDGSDLENVTESYPTNEIYPDWSPDGTKIVFKGEPGEWIYTMNPDGSDVRNLFVQGIEPVWSPDSSKIAFVWTHVSGGVATGYDIFVMNADGTGVVNLTNNPSINMEPTWSPDGRWIAFRGSRDDPNPLCGTPPGWGCNTEIYAVATDGSGTTIRLTNNTVPDVSPDWQPLCTITGTVGDDVIAGTTGPDVICALAGNDGVNSRAGNDTIIGGDGADVVQGANGDDIVFGAGGNDRVSGGMGGDNLRGGPGQDFVNGKDRERGNDVVDGGEDVDRCTFDAEDLVLNCPGAVS
jgi:dipeptidyl aminopeptidase/acylaminoacyl peptidase